MTETKRLNPPNQARTQTRAPRAPNDTPIHGTELLGAHFGAVRSALRAKRHTSLRDTRRLVLRELLHDQRVSQVLVRRSPRALEPRLVWPPWGGHAAHQRSSAPLRAMQCAPLCAEGGGSEQDERSVLPGAGKPVMPTEEQ